jgi:hypothetical protein
MAQYSGNLVGVVGVDGTIKTGVAANYRRVGAPMSNFGTRQIMFLAIRDIDIRPSTVPVTRDNYELGDLDLNNYGLTDSNDSPNTVIPDSYLWNPDSPLWKAINGVQLAAELAFIGQPGRYNDSDWDYAVIVGVYADTAASADAGEQHAYAANGMARTINQAVADATGQADIKVYPVFPEGLEMMATNGNNPSVDNFRSGHYGAEY